MRTLIHLLVLYSLVACGEEKKDNVSKQLEGFRYNVTLTRAIDSVEWVETTGQHEWWFFTGGVFKQISSDYIEPQYYGASQACNGTASGSYTVASGSVATNTEEGGGEGGGEEGEEEGGEGGGDAERKKLITLKYDGSREVTGLCRMTDRVLNVIMQPSSNLDIIDGQVVQRAGRLEKLY